MNFRLRSSLLKLAVLMFSVIPVSAHASAHSNSRLAEVSLVGLDQGSQLSFASVSDQGFVVVALRDCTLSVDDRSTTLKAGDYKKVTGIEPLHLRNSGLGSTSVVLIRVRSALQPLTIETTTLTHHQQLEDASDRNATLLVAVDSLQLSDQRDLADEGSPWKPSLEPPLNLKRGETAWIKAGMHRIRNRGTNAVRFVTVEW